MKRIAKAIVFLLMLNNVYAQELTNNYKPKIDSLQSLLNRKNHDTTRLMLMHSLAQVYAYNLELVKSVEMIHSAQELNKKLKFPKGYAAEYRSIASLMNRPTNDYFQNYARWEFEKIKQKDDFFALNLSYPDLKEESRMKFVKIRIQQLRESLTYAKKINNNKLVGLIYSNLSANYMFLGDAKTVNPMYLDDYRKAIIYADSTLIVGEKLNETSLSIYPLLIQNFCYTKLGDAIKAKEPEIKSNTILAGLESPQEKMIYMSGMSNKYFYQQRYALSVEYALKAGEAAILLKDTLQQIKNYLLLGSNYYQKSMSKKAIDNFKKAIELYEINKKVEYDFIFNKYYELGYLYVALKEYDQAKKYFAGGNALFQLSNNKDIIRQGKFDQIKSKGAILMSQELYAEALAKFFESFKFEKDTINNLSNTNYRIAFCYQKLGNLKKSILYGEKSYKSTPKIDKKQLLETSKLLEEVYKQNNQPSKAYEYLQIHDKILTDNAA